MTTRTLHDLAFLAMGAAILVYVALCAPLRDRIPEADAWEHHRALVALVENPKNPGNPTFASETPSIRYTPSMVVWAHVCRATGLDPYDALTAAAVLNTALLLVALRLLLGVLGHGAAAPWCLLAIISLYGGAPGYANSLALADLSWHQVNPSALAMPMALLAAVGLLLMSRRRGAMAATGWVLMAGGLAIALLDHAMTGVFACVLLAVLGLFEGVLVRPRLLTACIAAGLVMIGAALLWPWYSFLQAVRTPPDPYWFNPVILRRMALEWCAPAIALSITLLLVRDRPVALRFLAVGWLLLALAAAAYVVKSPTLARLPLTAATIFQIGVGLFIADSRPLSATAWLDRLRGLVRGHEEPGPAGFAALQILAIGACAFFLLPQLGSMLRDPHQMRHYLAGVTGARPAPPSPRPALRAVLAPVAPGDVVISDPLTMWAVPSVSAARMQAAVHFEFFEPRQAERMADAERFLSPRSTPRDRAEIIQRWNVRWILLSAGRTDPAVFAGLTAHADAAGAIRAREGDLVLIAASSLVNPE